MWCREHGCLNGRMSKPGAKSLANNLVVESGTKLWRCVRLWNLAEVCVNVDLNNAYWNLWMWAWAMRTRTCKCELEQCVLELANVNLNKAYWNYLSVELYVRICWNRLGRIVTEMSLLIYLIFIYKINNIIYLIEIPDCIIYLKIKFYLFKNGNCLL